jgi:hypothetical protein
VILPTSGYVRSPGEEEDPRELMRPFASEAMRIWPISTRVNKPENDDPTILDEIVLGTALREKMAGQTGIEAALMRSRCWLQS